MIYVFLADGFEEVEALGPVDVLRRAGVEVKTVGVTGKTVTGSHRIPVIADLTVDEAVTDGLEAVVLPGGLPGTTNLESDEKVQSFLTYCNDNGKYICAICAAPSVLGHRGFLENREATAYPGYDKELKGAKLSDKYVVRSGKFITARGAGVSLLFGAEIAAAFVGEEKAQDILKAMQYRLA